MPSTATIRGRSTGPAPARRAPRSRAAISVICSWPRSCWASAPVVARRSLLEPARGSNAGRDPAERLRPLGRGVAPPLPALGIRMTAPGLFALLFAPSGQNAGGGLTVFLVQIGALIAIFYFMLIRPQRRQQERHRQLLASLQRGDRIVTSGGIIGEVVHLKDDEVTVKSGESRLIVQRANIANILNRSVEAAKPQ